MSRPRLTRRGQAVVDFLVTVWFVVTMLALMGAWFGAIPTP